MASFVRNQLAKQMSRYFKNINPDLFTLSFFRGEATLNNLELRPEVLQQLLGLPKWLILRKATISSIQARVTWTKIKSQAVEIIIGDMYIELEATGNPTKEDFVTLDPALYGLDGTTPKKEKYGFIDAIIDGIRIDVSNIEIKLKGPDFDGTVHILHSSLQSCTEQWEERSELKHTRVEDRSTQSITLFKVLKIHALRGKITPNTKRISEAAQADPFIFTIPEPRIRIFKRKSLLDNTRTLSTHMTLDINRMRLQLTRFQIQTLNHMVWSLSKMMTATRGVTFGDTVDASRENADTPAGGSVAGDFGLHVKLKRLELALKSHIKHVGQDAFLTSLIITDVSIHHFEEQPMGARLRSKDALRQSYLNECGQWMHAVNEKWYAKYSDGAPTPTGRMPAAKGLNAAANHQRRVDRTRLRQAATSVTVGRVRIITTPAVSTKDRAKRKRSEAPMSAVAAAMEDSFGGSLSSGVDDEQELTPLLDSNYEDYHLPADIPLVQLDIISYFALPEARSASAVDVRSPTGRAPVHSRHGSASSLGPTPSSTETTIDIPPGAIYARINPVKITLNLPAVLHLMEFANSCRLAAPVMKHENVSSSFEDLGLEISLCPSSDKMLPLWQKIVAGAGNVSRSASSDTDDLGDVAEDTSGGDGNTLLSTEEYRELRRVYKMRMEELQALEELDDGAEDVLADDHVSNFMRYTFEVQLPTIVLPNRLDGPPRVRNQEIRFTVSRATLTNCMQESRFIGSSNYDAFYRSPLVTAAGAGLVDVPLHISDDGVHVEALPRRSWLPSGRHSDTPDVMHLNIDEIWGTLHNDDGEHVLLDRCGIAAWVVDTTRKQKVLREAAEARRVVSTPAKSASVSPTKSGTPRGTPSGDDAPPVPAPRLSESSARTSSRSSNNDALTSPSGGANAVPSLFASSYALISIPNKMHVNLDNSSLMFLMRFNEEFNKITSLMDDGKDMPHQFTFLAINDISISLFPETHMLKDVTPTCAAAQQKAIDDHQRKCFKRLDIHRIHVASHSGKRETTQLIAIEDVGVRDPDAPPMTTAPPTPSRAKTLALSERAGVTRKTPSSGSRTGSGRVSTSPQWDKVSVAIRVRTPCPTAEHTYRFYTQLDQVLLEKEESNVSPGPLGKKLSSPTLPLPKGESVGNPDVKGNPDVELAGGAVPMVSEGDRILASRLLDDTQTHTHQDTGGMPGASNARLVHLPRPEMEMEVRGMTETLDSDTVALLLAMTDDYFPDDTYPPQSLQINFINTSVTVLDMPTYLEKKDEPCRLVSALDTATTRYDLNKVNVVRDGNHWVINSDAAVPRRANSGIRPGADGDDLIQQLQEELAEARERIAVQEELLQQADATRASLLEALSERDVQV
eukprot:m.1398071 g.1398071  ORF g.1398071 m.1398071 type:complete len:1364 (-) comp24999_c0_seq15:3967-8058(-)